MTNTSRTDHTDRTGIGSILEVRRIFDDASDFIFVVDRENRIVAVNRSFQDILGRGVDEIVGKKCYEIVHRTTEPPAACPHARLMNGGGGSVVQQVFGSRPGIHVLLSVMPIFAESDRLLATIHAGKVVYEEQHSLRVGAAKKRPGQSTDSTDIPARPLTPRQRTVLELLTEGRSSKEIAFQLKLSPRTVEFHKSQLMARLKVKSLAGLIKFAFLEDLTQ